MKGAKITVSLLIFTLFVSSQFIGVCFGSLAMGNRVYEIGPPVKVYSIIETSDGGYAIAGGIYAPDDFWLVKIDESGNILWNMTYGGKKQDVAYSLVETSDGGYALTGGGLLTKIDSFGNIQWNQTYGGASLVLTSDGGYAFVAGASLFKTDSHGIIQWSQTYRTDRHPIEEWSQLNSVIETSKGGFVIVGDIFDWFIGDGLVWLIKTDNYGVIPEFSSWTLLPVFVIATFSLFLFKKKLFNNDSQEN